MRAVWLQESRKHSCIYLNLTVGVFTRVRRCKELLGRHNTHSYFSSGFNTVSIASTFSELLQSQFSKFELC